MRGPSDHRMREIANMRNDLTACDGPQLANAGPIGRGRSRRRRTMLRGLLALPLALALIAPGATAIAAAPTSGYSQTAPAPKTTPATTPTTTSSPKGEAAPTQTSSTPSTETQPANSSSEPTATTANGSSKTLPFTGLDLRWMILGGVLLVGMGGSILFVQRGRSTKRR
jgi:hypothetical protein